MEHSGSYYQCDNCTNIIDYNDSHCPNCGSQDETELNANEVKFIAEGLLIIRDYNKNKIGRKLIEMLKSHDDY